MSAAAACEASTVVASDLHEREVRGEAGIVTFTVGVNAGTGGAPIRSVRVTLGDGTVIYSGTGGGTFAYRFGGAGTYTATATATDALGGTATTSTVILVNP